MGLGTSPLEKRETWKHNLLRLEEYVPVNAATKRVMDLSVAGMRQVVGDRLYHTLGDAAGDAWPEGFSGRLF